MTHSILNSAMKSCQLAFSAWGRWYVTKSLQLGTDFAQFLQWWRDWAKIGTSGGAFSSLTKFLLP